VRVVVVGSHGKGVLRKALLGSVSEYLTHHCKRPVLVVRGQLD
jgi:nucleotide-binding universal stress UspA family protein